VREYWAAPEAQPAFDRISRDLTELEIKHTIAVAQGDSLDPATIRLGEELDEARRELAALPNSLAAEIVVAERFDIALAARAKALALQQRLMLARLDSTDAEARRMVAVVGAIAARRDALHARQDTLHARFLAEPSPAAGEYIRVRLRPGDHVVEGRLLEVRGDSLLLARMGGTPTAIRLPFDATIERAVSRRGHAVEGALIGLVGAGWIGSRSRSPFDDERGLRGVVYGSLGALIGGLMGSTIYSETWAPVVWQRASSLTAPAGMGVGVRWASAKVRR
jgi:hypothetical protein